MTTFTDDWYKYDMIETLIEEKIISILSLTHLIIISEKEDCFLIEKFNSGKKQLDFNSNINLNKSSYTSIKDIIEVSLSFLSLK